MAASPSPARPFEPSGARPQPAHRPHPQPPRPGQPAQKPGDQHRREPAPPKPERLPHERGATILKWLQRAFERDVVVALQNGLIIQGELVGYDDYHIALLLDDGQLVLMNKGAVATYRCPALRLSEQEMTARRAARRGPAAAADEEKKEA